MRILNTLEGPLKNLKYISNMLRTIMNTLEGPLKILKYITNMLRTMLITLEIPLKTLMIKLLKVPWSVRNIVKEMIDVHSGPIFIIIIEVQICVTLKKKRKLGWIKGMLHLDPNYVVSKIAWIHINVTNFQILAYGTLFLGLGPRNLVDYCYRNNTVYIGQIIEILNDQNHFGSAKKCQEECEGNEICSFWTYFHHN